MRFHKRSTDGSGKCDAFYTGDPADVVLGVLFEIDPGEKPWLDRAEGLGKGYVEKGVDVETDGGGSVRAFTYVAEAKVIDSTLRPYSWYKEFVVSGAREHGLEEEYVNRLEALSTETDPDVTREARERGFTRPLRRGYLGLWQPSAGLVGE